MNRRFPLSGFVLAILAIVLSLSACAVAPPPTAVPPDAVSQFAGTFEGVCKVWETIRAKYPQLKESAILVREVGGIDDETWEAFVWIDANAQKLDRWLALICEARGGANNAHVIAREKGSVDWNAVGANVLKVAAFALSSGVL